MKKLNFKSNIKFYWMGILVVFLLILLINALFIKEFKNFSFETYFLVMIPIWIGVLGINGYETNKIKDVLRIYLEENYPDKIKIYDDKGPELLNSDSEGILDLINDEMLSKDEQIIYLGKESKSITNFMYFTFLAMPVVLLSVVFLILKR